MENYFLKYLLITFLVICYQQSWAQSSMERKIIIENGQFYYCTVDNELQLATLHKDNIDKDLQSAAIYNIPIGRQLTEPFVPLCFDIRNNELTGLNWILNNVNNQYEALKKTDLASLKPVQQLPGREAMIQLLYQSFEHPFMAYYTPWMFMLKRNNVLEHTFYDMVVLQNGHLVLALCNQGELFIWEYDGREWKHSEPLKVAFNEYFSLVNVDNNAWLISNDGNVYSIGGSAVEHASLLLQGKKLNADLDAVTLIVDKDHSQVLYVQHEYLMQAMSFKELVNNKALPLISK